MKLFVIFSLVIIFVIFLTSSTPSIAEDFNENNFEIIKCADIKDSASKKCANKYRIKSLSVKELLNDKEIEKIAIEMQKRLEQLDKLG